MSITSTTKPWNPEIPQDKGSVGSYLSLKGGHENKGSDQVTLFEDQRSSAVSVAGKYREIEASKPATEIGSVKGAANEDGQVDEKGVGNGGANGEEDEIVYPGPLKLFILVFGIALSVFLISLDRTIITTVSLFSFLHYFTC